MNQLKEVRFDMYCRRCKNKTLDETKDPCNECLEVAYRVQTAEPIYFEKGTKKNGQ